MYLINFKTYSRSCCIIPISPSTSFSTRRVAQRFVIVFSDFSVISLNPFGIDAVEDAGISCAKEHQHKPQQATADNPCILMSTCIAVFVYKRNFLCGNVCTYVEKQNKGFP